MGGFRGGRKICNDFAVKVLVRESTKSAARQADQLISVPVEGSADWLSHIGLTVLSSFSLQHSPVLKLVLFALFFLFCYLFSRVAVVGNVDAGKSTLLGVLTHGELDNGRGFARQKLFRHKHEMESGRTSSVGNDILGFDQEGQVSCCVVNGQNHWRNAFLWWFFLIFCIYLKVFEYQISKKQCSVKKDYSDGNFSC